MKHRLLETVVLNRDLPDHGLCRGDLGAVVEVYEADGIEIEFVRASGSTKAVVTLSADDVRPDRESDQIAVRSVERAA